MNTKQDNQTASAPETRKNDPNKNWAMYNPDKVNPRTIPSEKPTAQHSLLPWQVWPNESKRDIYSVDGFKVATCESIARDNSQADARLIVASVNHAAQLAEALRALHACHRAFSSNDNWTSLDDEAREASEKALAAYESEVR